MAQQVIDRFAPRFIHQAQQELEQLRDDVNGIRAVMLATVDGFMLASAPQQSGEKLAAVSASMLAMGGALVREAGLEGCRSLTIETNNGQIYVREIQAKGTSLILMVLSASGTALAHVLLGVRKTQEKLAQAEQVMVNT